MESKKIEWDLKIAQMTTKIYSEYPELVNFLPETPPNNPNNIEANVKKLEAHFGALESLVAKYSKTLNETENTNEFPALKSYPASEDIYNKAHQETEINPENPNQLKTPNKPNTEPNTVEQNRWGGNLDIPGADLDDAQENIGSEDEENNYYSLGGDNHNDLEEDKS